MMPKTVNGIAIINRTLQLKPLAIGSSKFLQEGHASRESGIMETTHAIKSKHKSTFLNMKYSFMRNKLKNKV